MIPSMRSRPRSRRPYTAPPPPEGLPAWLSSAAVNEWVQIPNSTLTTNISDAYFTAMGLPRPSVLGSVSWGENKYGITWSPWENISWGNPSVGGHVTHSGMGFDDVNSAMTIGGGDAHWADNSVQRFRYNLDTPVWDQPIASCHHDFFRNYNYPRTTPDTYPTLIPGDDPRDERMYDGSHRGGHPYWFMHFIRGPIGNFGSVSNENVYAHFGLQQHWPLDLGFSAAVHVAPFAEGVWNPDVISPISNVPFFQNDQNAWQQKHPITEDIYIWGADGSNAGVLTRWNKATNDYTTLLYSVPEEGSWLTGSIDWTNGYILFIGRFASAGGTVRNWMLDLDDNIRVPVTLTGPYAGINPHRRGGVWWNPDLGKHLYFPDDGNVYTIEKTGPTEFYVDLLAMTGTAPAAGSMNQRSGGPLSNFQFDSTLHGMFLRIADYAPSYFFRTL